MNRKKMIGRKLQIWKSIDELDKTKILVMMVIDVTTTWKQIEIKEQKIGEKDTAKMKIRRKQMEENGI